MSEKLAYVKQLLREIEGGQLARGRAEETLRVLDEYEGSLVRIEGVQEAYEAFGREGYFRVQDVRGNFVHVENEIGGVILCVVAPKEQEARLAYLDRAALKRHIAQCLGALKYDEEG